MKKVIFFICLFFFTVSFSAAKSFLSDRYFEIQVGVPVNISNNILPVRELLKEEVYVDLPQISKEIPNEGFVFTSTISPFYAMNIKTPVFDFGMSFGIDIYEKFSLSRDIFDFLGKGNQIGESIDVSINDYTDIFAAFEFDFGFKTKKVNFNIVPAAFVPMLSISGTVGQVSFVNDSEGNISMNYFTEMDMYTNLSNLGSSISPDSLPFAFEQFGFDLALNANIPLSDKLSLGTDLRIPIIPGRLTNKNSYYISCDFSTSFLDITNIDMNSDFDSIDNEPTVLLVNRPLKGFVYFEYLPIGYMLTLRLGAGLGVHNPFLDGSFAYPEYFFGSTIDFYGFCKLALSTEYTDQIFKHQLGLTFNLRIIQIDTGVSLQSASFEKSFSTAGFGAYFVYSVGF